MADFIGRMENRFIAIDERGVSFVNDNTISRLSIARQSLAFYVQNPRFETRQVENPETGVLESQTTFTADVLYAAPPEDHRLATERVIEADLFREAR